MLPRLHWAIGQAVDRDMRPAPVACRQPRSVHRLHSLPGLASDLLICSAKKCLLMQPRQCRGHAIAPANHLHCSVGMHTRPGRPLAASVDHPTTTTTVQSTDLQGTNHQQRLNHQQLLDLGATFVNCWFTGIAKGPQAVEQLLSNIMDDNATLMADRVGLLEDKQGLPEVMAELERAHLEYHRSEHRPMLYAASEDNQRVYALVEGRYQDVGALPGHPATFRISKVHHILALLVKGGRVEKLWLRRQLTEEDKDELLHDPLTCYPSSFPRDNLMLTDAAAHELASEKIVQSVKAWWMAWSTDVAPTAESSNHSNSSPDDSRGGAHQAAAGVAASQQSLPRRNRGRSDLSSTLAAHLLAPGYRMWDAYGLWPAMRAQGRRHLTKDSAMHYLQQLRYKYNIRWQVLDAAVAEGSLACFTHWQAKFEPKWPAAPPAAAVAGAPAAGVGKALSDGTTAAAPSSEGVAAAPEQQQQQPGLQPDWNEGLIVDGLEVDLFDDHLQLHDTWLFRGPITDEETKLFLEYDRQQAAAEAALAASEQESIRQARREQREQQLSELMTWMAQYQQQWGDYVKHMQKALARQQQLAQAQIKQQVYVVDQLQQHYQKLQQEQKQQFEQLQQEQKEQDAAAAAAAAATAQVQLEEPSQALQQEQQQRANPTD